MRTYALFLIFICTLIINACTNGDTRGVTQMIQDAGASNLQMMNPSLQRDAAIPDRTTPPVQNNQDAGQRRDATSPDRGILAPLHDSGPTDERDAGQDPCETLEICDAQDNDCDGETDEGLLNACGGCTILTASLGDHCEAERIGSCHDGVVICMGRDTTVCRPLQGPHFEICNDLDDDCDGETDETETFARKGRPCMTGRGECHAEGSYICTSDGRDITCNAEALEPNPETCDGLDNDCDGSTDEEITNRISVPSGAEAACAADPLACRGICRSQIERCELGAWAITQTSQGPTTETCNDRDDDCDGGTDEPWRGRPWPENNLDGLCRISRGTLCEATGNFICTPDGTNIMCNAVPCRSCARPETCDGRDEDCDREVDENLNRPCYSGPLATRGVGTCRDGVQACSFGEWGICEDEILPTPEEACDDELDNNCDGVTDNVMRDCYTGRAGTIGLGICHGGMWTCTTEALRVCMDEVVPTVETCNGLDDNCDGTTDEGCYSCSIGPNHLRNPSFEDYLDSWTFTVALFVWPPPEARAIQECDASCTLRIEITRSGDSIYDIILSQFPTYMSEEDEYATAEYELCFLARAAAPRTMVIIMEASPDDLPPITISLEVGWVRTCRRLYITGLLASRLNFAIGGQQPTIWLDDVSLIRCHYL